MKLSICKASLLLLTSTLVVVQSNPILQSSASHGIVRRQHFHSLDETVIPRAKVVSTQTLPPKMNKDAIRKQVRYGPYHVPGSNDATTTEVVDKHDSKGAMAFQERLETLCDECVILYGITVPVYENGTVASDAGGSIFSHHLTTVNRGRAERHAICPGNAKLPPKQPGLFIGGSSEKDVELFTTADGKIKTGYYTTATDKIDVFAEFMNYRPEVQNIYLVVEFEYLPGKPANYLNTQNLALSAGDSDCGDKLSKIVDKKYSIASKDWISPSDGYILNVRGHQHDGGSGIDVYINDKYMCSSIPTYQKAESRGPTETEHLTIVETSLCKIEQPLKKGDRLRFTGRFDLEKYPQRQSNTGYLERTSSGIFIQIAFPVGYELP